MSSEFIKRFHDRPMSWSQISSFEYSPAQWYDIYVLGKKQESKELTFGSIIDKKIQDDPKFMPSLPRYPHMQYKMKVMFDGVPLVGLPDGLDLDKYLLADYKTGKKAWDQKRADETGQLTMYLLLLYISKKLPPEKFKCYIHWLPTEERGDFSIDLIKDCKPITFETKRTMTDVLLFGLRIKKVIKDMEEYLLTLPAVSTTIEVSK